MIISTATNTLHTFDKIYLFVKTLGKLEIEGKFLNPLKGTYKSGSHHRTYGRDSNVFSLRFRKEVRCPLSTLLSSIVLEILAHAYGKRKK